MKLKQKTVGFIIVLITLALIGLIGIQIYLLKTTIDGKLQAFRQNVNTALSSIVQKLENRETVLRFFSVAGINHQNEKENLAIMNVDSSDSLRIIVNQKSDSTFSSLLMKWNSRIRMEDNKLVFMLEQPQQVKLRILDSLGNPLEEITREYKSAGKHEIDLKNVAIQNGSYNINFLSDSTTFFLKVQNGTTKNLIRGPGGIQRKQIVVERVLDELTQLKKKPIKERIHPAALDSIVAETLQENHIDIPYAYGIISTELDSVKLSHPPSLSADIQQSDFRRRLFPNDLFVEKNELALYFPQQNLYLLRKMGIAVLISLLFIITIIFCFVYIIRTIFMQKQFSGLLTDFINNMTHEFKTPISTIAIASESITNPAILDNQEKICRYSQIIRDESTRMRNQVEKILQMASLEEGDFELNLKEIDIHKLLQKTIDNFVVQIEKQDGQIRTHFAATDSVIHADELYFGNVIHNLLDNAIKYCRKSPDIFISTGNRDNQITIKIKDNGIGLKAEEKESVFDKYYRVPTGNVHDVKGFGLGLSYVKIMVEAHGGKIDLNSEWQKGTTFELTLPQNRE